MEGLHDGGEVEGVDEVEEGVGVCLRVRVGKDCGASSPTSSPAQAGEKDTLYVKFICSGL